MVPHIYRNTVEKFDADINSMRDVLLPVLGSGVEHRGFWDSGEVGKLETVRCYLVDQGERGGPRGTLSVKSTFIILHLIFFHFLTLIPKDETG